VLISAALTGHWGQSNGEELPPSPARPFVEYVMEELASFSCGSGQGQLGRMSQATSGLIDFDVSPEGTVFLGDGTNRRVYVVDSGGSILDEVPVEASGLSMGPILAESERVFLVLLSPLQGDRSLRETGILLRKVDRQGRKLWEENIPGEWIYHRFLPHDLRVVAGSVLLTDWRGEDVVEIGSAERLRPRKQWTRGILPGVPVPGLGLFLSYWPDSLGERMGGTFVVKDRGGAPQGSWRPREQGVLNGFLCGPEGDVYTLYGHGPSLAQGGDQKTHEAVFRVQRLSARGKKRGEVVLSLKDKSLRVVRVAVDGRGRIYQLLVGADGAVIMRWTPQRTDRAK
jgi:hypothetical protein